MNMPFLNRAPGNPMTAFAPMGGGYAPLPFHHHHGHSHGPPRPHYHGFCPECCHPQEACCCHHRHCRKESKELLVEPQEIKKDDKDIQSIEKELRTAAHVFSTVRVVQGRDVEMPADRGASPKAKGFADTIATLTGVAGVTGAAAGVSVGVASAFIGGGCCVHLSIEYMPQNALAPADGIVAVAVTDSEQTIMLWGKVVKADSGYQIQEDIITTHPGAKLLVAALNVTARVRWCEVFSC